MMSIYCIPSMFWPYVQGQITMSGVGMKTSNDGVEYKLALNYDYTVSGKTFHGQRRTRITFTGSQHHIESLQKRYPVGSQVAVYYHPKSPELAVLEPGIPDDMVYLFIFSFIFIAVGVISFIIVRIVFR